MDHVEVLQSLMTKWRDHYKSERQYGEYGEFGARGFVSCADELQAVIAGLSDKPEDAWHEIEQMCMVTEAITPDKNDIRGTLDRLIDYHVWLNKPEGEPVTRCSGYCPECGHHSSTATNLHPPRSHGVVVDEAAVEKLAKWMCRREISNPSTMEQVTWAMTKWKRFESEARAALVAALGDGE